MGSMTCNDNLELRDNSSLKKACKLLSRIEKVTTIGINCINPKIVKSVIKKMKKNTSKKILIYPNSGEKYENIHKTWKGKKEFNLSSIKNWLDESPDIIGGCCRVGVKEINYIKSLLRE